MSEITEIFEFMGEELTITTNDCGTSLTVTFGGCLVEDSFGDCIRWPAQLGWLHGAAFEAASRAFLKEQAIEVVKRRFIELLESSVEE